MSKSEPFQTDKKMSASNRDVMLLIDDTRVFKGLDQGSATSSSEATVGSLVHLLLFSGSPIKANMKKKR